MKIWRNPKASLGEAGAAIRAGRLVAFPTETVYGLGANGLSTEALTKLFKVKQRPATDPLILHVLSAEEAAKLQEPTHAERVIIEQLQAAFWPGPLSIVARAAAHVPQEVTANTPFVAVRCPEHPIARGLIASAGVPIAGPSANPFGRISPTQADHVEKYFSQEPDVDLLASEGCCSVGIESTLVMVHTVNDEPVAEILRDGIITKEALSYALEGRSVRRRKERNFRELSHDESQNDSEIMEGPGMFLKHYAPALPTYLLLYGHDLAVKEVSPTDFSTACLLDIGPAFPHLKNQFKHRVEVRCVSASDLSSKLFQQLHEIEFQALRSECTALYLGLHELLLDASEYTGALDRIFRACSGKVRQPSHHLSS